MYLAYRAIHTYFKMSYPLDVLTFYWAYGASAQAPNPLIMTTLSSTKFIASFFASSTNKMLVCYSYKSSSYVAIVDW